MEGVKEGKWGERQNPYVMHMQKMQYGNVHSMTIFTEHKQKGI